MRKNFLNVMLFILLVNFSAFALEDKDDEYSYPGAAKGGCATPYDPYEKLNRKFFVFNSVLDYFILRPVAVTYRKVTNDYVKARVGSFLDNIATPLTSVNYLLQGNFKESLKSLWKFGINSTIGVAGLFDVSSKAGLNPPAQTFGNTLAHYGIGAGPYLIVPFVGATNARDVMDTLVLNTSLNPLKYYLHSSFKQGLLIGKLVHDRSEMLPFTDAISKNSTDPYVAIREAIHQNREYNVQYPEGFKCPVVKSQP